MYSGFAIEVSVGLVTPFTPYHRLGEHALALIRARYRQFWSCWSFLTPFSAFDGLVHVVNLDEAETLLRLMKLKRSDERGVTINQGRWPFVRLQ